MEMVKGSVLDPFAVTATLTLLQVVGHIPVPHIVPPPPPPQKNPKTCHMMIIMNLMPATAEQQKTVVEVVLC